MSSGPCRCIYDCGNFRLPSKYCSGGVVHCAAELGGTVGEYEFVERAVFLWREVYNFFFTQMWEMMPLTKTNGLGSDEKRLEWVGE